MGRFDSNTLFMGILAVAFTVFSVSLLADTIYHTGVDEFGYPIEVADAPAASGGDEGAGGPEPVLALLASADPSAGESVFKRCSSCHTNDPSGGNKTGPGLWGVVNRPIASHPGFGYSSALTGHAAEAPGWTYEELNGFLWKPKDWVPGTSMGFAGLSDAQDRADVIAYLRSLADSPAPLPTEEEIAAVSAPAEGEAAVTDGETPVADEAATDEPNLGEGVVEETVTDADIPGEDFEETPSTVPGGEATDASVEGDAGQAGTDGAPVATDVVTEQGVPGNEMEDAPAVIDGRDENSVQDVATPEEAEAAPDGAAVDGVVVDGAAPPAPASNAAPADGATTEPDFVIVPVEPATPEAPAAQ